MIRRRFIAMLCALVLGPGAFEARAAGPYGFLNDGKFLSSSPGSGSGGVSVTFYERK